MSSGGLLRSSGAATLSQVWRMAVTYGTIMVLRRLIDADDWGLWHWSADLVFVLLGQVRDLGLPAQVVRDPNKPYGQLLAVEAGWGTLLALVAAAAAPVLAWGFTGGGVAVVPVLQALTLFLLFEGLAKVPLTFLEAELRIDRALVPELLRNLCFAGLSIGLALAGFGIWSLVAAHAAAAALFAGLLWLRTFRDIPLRWVRGSLAPLLRTSLPLMLMALLLLLLDTVDYQIIAASFPADAVGLYGGALTLALLVPRALEMPVRRALYPAFVAVRNEPERFFETYRLATVLLLAVQVPFALFLFFNAETLLVLAWGRDYAAAAPFLRILCFVPLVQPFARCAEDVLLARHEERLLILASFATLASLGGFGIAWSGSLGPAGMAWAKLVPVGSLLLTWAVYRVSPAGFHALVRDLLWVYALPLPAFALAWWAGSGRPRLLLALSLAAGLLSALAYARRFGGDFVRFFRQVPSLRPGS